MNEQVYPTKLQGKMTRIIGDPLSLDPDETVGPFWGDDCKEYNRWGFSLYSTHNGTLIIGYSFDNTLYFPLETIAIVGAVPEDRIYCVTRRYYRVQYTDVSGNSSQLRLSTIRKNG